MCGLVGVAGDLNGLHEKVLKTLLILDSLRGEDSTGVAFVRKWDAEVTVAKQLGSPFELFEDRTFIKAQRTFNRVMMGHNRYATSGGVTKSGAHPFEFDTLVGAHNGTLNSRFRLDDDKDFKVDSQALYHNIEKNGLKETIKRLGGAGNAWSLTWWNKEEESLNFLRNAERPMFLCMSKDGKAIFWASEYWMLDVALMKHGIARNEILATQEHAHLTFNINNQGVIEKPHVAEVKPDPVVYLPPVQSNNQRFPAQQTTTSNSQNTNGTSTVVELRPAVNVEPSGVNKQYAVTNPTGKAQEKEYVSIVKRTFEICAVKTDGNGGKYLSLYDPAEPFIDIRLYPVKQDHILFEHEGAEIVGQVTSFEGTRPADPKALRPYYKVNPWSVSYELEVPPIVDEDEEAILVMDHHGKFISPDDWKKRYSLCSWCSELLRPNQMGNRYTKGGDCLCPSCAKDTSVTELVTLI